MLLAVSFDVWNTLLNIEAVYRKLAEIVAEIISKDLLTIERIIYDTYIKVKKYRLNNNTIEVHKFVISSRNLLAKALGIDYDQLVEAIDLTFSSIIETPYMSSEVAKILYNDVMSTLNSLKAIDITMGVIGNNVFWESMYTRRVLRVLGLDKYFKTQVYSDEVGIFKPDRRIFLEFCRRIGIDVSKVIHVGDSVAEDVGGALSAGMKAMHIDRSRKEKNVVIELGLFLANSLENVMEALQRLG
ncbi:MAG: HAD family hydrolase [Ignisphaera sp.]